MRKIIKYVVIPLIIIILILGSLLYFKYNKKDKDNDNEIIKTLSGTKIKDNIYGYKLKEDIEFYIKITFIMDLAIKKIYHSIDTTFTIMKIN